MGCSATQGHATIAIGRMCTDQLIAITGTIAIITDRPARSLPGARLHADGTEATTLTQLDGKLASWIATASGAAVALLRLRRCGAPPFASDQLFGDDTIEKTLDRDYLRWLAG